LKFCKSGRPVGNDARTDERKQVLPERFAPRCEKLGAMIEFEVVGITRRHPTARATGFLENSNVVGVLQPARYYKSGKPGTYDCCSGHAYTLRDAKH
jgi:hypothetical protein